MIRTIVLLVLFSWNEVQADAGQRSCLPERTSAQIFWTVEAHTDSLLIHPLSSKVQLMARQSGGAVSLTLRFDPSFDGVSLPFNLFAVLVVKNGSVIAWWDYTRGCQTPGLSFFPGREIELPELKLVGAGPDQLQIMVWGKL